MPSTTPQIVLTRPEPQLQRTAKVLEKAGFIVQPLPLIQIAPPRQGPGRKDVAWTEAAAWLIFTSRHAVDAANKIWTTKPPGKVAAVGAATAKALSNSGWTVDWTAPNHNSESLINAAGAPRWQGPIALLSGAGGRRQISTLLRAKGCEVRKMRLYQRQTIHWDARTITDIVAHKPLIIFSSGFALRYWHKLLLEYGLPHGQSFDMLVASQRLCKLGRKLGFDGRIQALESISDTAILTALKKWNHD